MRDPKKGDITQIRQWELGWDAHNTMQLQRLAQLPLAEKIIWLEETHRMVRHIADAKNSKKTEKESDI